MNEEKKSNATWFGTQMGTWGQRAMETQREKGYQSPAIQHKTTDDDDDDDDDDKNMQNVPQFMQILITL